MINDLSGIRMRFIGCKQEDDFGCCAGHVFGHVVYTSK